MRTVRNRQDSFQSPPSVFPLYDPVPQSPSLSAPMALPDYIDRGLGNLTYDQVVAWWNALRPENRSNLLKEGKKLSRQSISTLRTYYQEYLPQDYYPPETYSPSELSACDYYLIYYRWEHLMRECKEFSSRRDFYSIFQMC